VQFHLRVLFVSRHRVAAQCRFLFLQCNCYSFSSIFFLWSKNPPLSARTRGIPCEARTQRGVRRGRKLSDCRHLSVGLSLINDGNIPPYTVTRPAAGTRPTPSVVYKRYCRYRDDAQLFYPLLQYQPQPPNKKRITIVELNADPRFSMKSFSLRRIYRNDRYSESNLRRFHALQISY